MINRIKEIKVGKKKDTSDYSLIKWYDILVVGEQEKLIKPVNEINSKMEYYITTNELFDIMHDAHISIGHGGRNHMIQEWKKNTVI